MQADRKKTSLSELLIDKSGGQSAKRPPDQQESEACQALQGDLKQKPISWLLKAAQHYEVTGVLLIGSPACKVTVQFGLGRAVHAFHPLCKGAEAIMDLFIWQDGQVRFEPGKLPESASIQETIEELVLRGEAYLQNLAFLKQNGINEMSFLVRPPGRLAEGELDQRLSRGPKIDLELQREFYSNIYGTRNLKDTAEKLDLPASQWVSITANLLQLGLLLTPDGKSLQLPHYSLAPDTAPDTVPDMQPKPGPGAATFLADRLPKPAPTAATPPPALQPKPAPSTLASLQATDKETPTGQEEHWSGVAVDLIRLGVPDQIIELDPAGNTKALKLLNRSDTGIMSSEILQFFLERDFRRACRLRTVISLVLFCVRLNDTTDQNVPPEICRLLTKPVSQILGDAGMFGHFGNCAFAIVLPDIDKDQACWFADKVNGDLPKVMPALSRFKPSLHFGIASVPCDATDLKGLVHAAQTAMLNAATQALPRVQTA